MTIYDALKFATFAHEGQYRKYTGEEYITHPIAVADLVEEYLDYKGYSEEEVDTAIQIALLHDTVEDTDVTIEEIQRLFGFKVAQGVWFLTKTPSFVGNRAERKALCEERLAKAPEVIKIIKTCDMHHNSKSIEEHDPNFYELFKTETKSLLKAMGTENVLNNLIEMEI
jgi:(p)ppGpp synthase/HD superfamily hydrolase